MHGRRIGASSVADDERPIRFRASYARMLLALAALFVVLVSLGLHGYSISNWRSLVGDDSEATEILVGEARLIRYDDWNVILPLALAQAHHDPPFPVVNTTIGAGYNVLVPFSIPVAHPLAVFTPTLWGYFIGDDAGMAWMWWGRLFGLFIVWMAVLLVVTRNQVPLSVLGSLVIVASPFIQFWSLRPTLYPIFGGLSFLAALGIVFARRTPAILGAGLLLGWAVACFALTLYPPHQISLAYVMGPLFVAVVWEHRRAVSVRESLGWRLAAVGVAGGILVAAVVLLFGAAGEAIELVRDSSYPGDRVSTGGDRTLDELFASNLALPLWVERWGSLGNICHSASFWLLSPALLVGAIWRARSRRLDSAELVLAAAVLGFMLHATWSMPEWLARATGFSFVPGDRSMIGLGLADSLLVARMLSRERRPSRLAAISVAVVWTGFLAVVGWRFSEKFPEFGLLTALALALANGVLAGLALLQRRSWIPVALLLGATLCVSGWFNPLVQGGSEFLLTNPLSKRIVEIDQEQGHRSVWLVFGSGDSLHTSGELGSLFRILGVRAINGVHPVPQLDLWEGIDPSGRHHDTFNRYAHVMFSVSRRPGAGLMGAGKNWFVIAAHPEADFLRDLGVTHVLLHGVDAGSFAAYPSYRLIDTIGRNSLFEINRSALAPSMTVQD